VPNVQADRGGCRPVGSDDGDPVGTICPECNEALRLTCSVTEVVNAERDLPLDDDLYD